VSEKNALGISRSRVLIEEDFVTIAVVYLMFTNISRKWFATAFAHRHAASPSVDARPPRPWGGRSSSQIALAHLSNISVI